jgi:hypothetical protein
MNLHLSGLLDSFLAVDMALEAQRQRLHRGGVSCQMFFFRVLQSVLARTIPQHTDRAKIPARERVHLLYYHYLLSTHERLGNDILDQSVCVYIISHTIV